MADKIVQDVVDRLYGDEPESDYKRGFNEGVVSCVQGFIQTVINKFPNEAPSQLELMKAINVWLDCHASMLVDPSKLN